MLNSKVASVLGGLLAAVPAFAYESSYNMPVGVTPISREVHGLHMLIFWVCVAIAILVFGAMIYSIWKFRKSTGAVPDPTLTHSTKIEVVWTVIPVVILISMAIPAAKTLVKMEDTRNSELTVKVIGYQWKWQYDYLGKGVAFYSTLAAESNQARQLNSGVDRHPGQGLPAGRRQPAGRPGRHQGAPAADRQRRDPLVVGTGLRGQEGRDPGLHQRGLVQGRARSAATPASARSCAAATTASCRSSCEVLSKDDFAKWLAAKQEAAKAAAAGAQPAATTAMTTPAAAPAAAL